MSKKGCAFVEKGVRHLLLLSNSTEAGGHPYLEYALNEVKAFFDRFQVKKILFVPYAATIDYDSYYGKVKTAFKKIDIEVESIHLIENPVTGVMDAKGLFIGGGNTFLLLKTLYEKNLIDIIQKRVSTDGIPYMGASAGSNVATINICTTNDMPICQPPSFKALHFIPFNINPHYDIVNPVASCGCRSICMGETRDQRLGEYLDMPESSSVLALMEGSILHVDGNTANLKGIAKARLFKRGEDPKWYEAGDDMSFLLNDG